MFMGCAPATITNIIQLENWNVSSVTDMTNMFILVLIPTQVFTDILTGWKVNGGGVNNGIEMGVDGLQTAFAANGLEAYYNSQNWVFKDQGGNTVNIWI
jgi:hypothetical protein